jgi:hypothetical protein
VISGAPRSGTSLLYNLFDNHPDVTWLVSEGFFFENLYDVGVGNATLFLAAARRPLDELIAGLRAKDLIPPLHKPSYLQTEALGTTTPFSLTWDWNEDRFRRVLAEELPRARDISSLWRALSMACAEGIGQMLRQFTAIKSPDYCKSTSAAAATIAEARGVAILRDPFGTLDSLKRSRELRNEKLLTWPLLAASVAEMKAMLERIRSAPKDRLYCLRYEDLVATPERTMRDLAAWLGLDFRPSLLEPTMFGQTWPGFSSFDGKTEGVSAEPAHRRVRALTADDQSMIRDHLQGFREFGYEF